MPVQKIHKNTIKARNAGGKPKIIRTKEWFEALEILTSASLKPYEAVSITFANGSCSDIKHPCLSMVRELRKKIEELGLPYDVDRRKEEEVYIISR